MSTSSTAPIPNSDMVDTGARLVEIINVSKSFRAIKALRNVSFDVKSGEVHALVGENGAGKSTLMKILSGVHRSEGGVIKVNGGPVDIPNPRVGRQLGIGIIYQELALVPHLTVAENILIKRLSPRFGLIGWRELNRRAGELLSRLGFGRIDPRTKVADLGVAHRQIVEIAKGLSENVRVLILDEPTSVLAPQEIDHLFAVLGNLRSHGVGIVYISHRLDEIFRIADRITVLKDGAVVRTVTASEIEPRDLITLMIGRTITSMFPPKTSEIGEEVLRVEGLRRKGQSTEISFSVRAGEIFGISGLVGSGRTEILRAIFGADPKRAGAITVCGRKLKISCPRDAVRGGLALVPESRKDDGLILNMPVRHNITLPSLGQVSGFGGIIRRRRERNTAEALVSKLQIKTASVEADVADLSGGNQQKVVLAKWLSTKCKALLLDEPTRGVDVGAKVELYRLIRELAAAGLAVVLVSSEMMELIGLCDRVAVVNRGSFAGVLEGPGITEENIIRLAVEKNLAQAQAAY